MGACEVGREVVSEGLCCILRTFALVEAVTDKGCVEYASYKTKLELRQKGKNIYLYAMPAPVVAAFQYHNGISRKVVCSVQMQKRKESKAKQKDGQESKGWMRKYD